MAKILMGKCWRESIDDMYLATNGFQVPCQYKVWEGELVLKTIKNSEHIYFIELK